jgi:hypothetical protein
MADSIKFTNVSFAGGKFAQDTLEFNYPPSPPPGKTTYAEFKGSLSFTASNGSKVEFKEFVISCSASAPNVYHLESVGPNGELLQLSWTGTTPTSFDGGTVVLDGEIYDKFVDNSITPTVCFAAGTLIRTPVGDVAVETLKAGDLVVTGSGDLRPVKWMGHTDVDFRRTPRGSPGLPIRIAANAFGPARPSQDLYLSLGHSVCVDLLGEVLIPVGYLVNGSTVAEVETDAISYWHVELESHDILIANNLPAESYLAMANRGAFEELRGVLPAMLEGHERTHADFCRPVITGGPALDFVRQRLAARVEEIGWKPERDPDLHLTVDGRIVRPLAEDGSAAFLFRADAKNVRLMSNTFNPTAFGSSDNRTLGVMLLGLALSGSGGEPCRIALDDDRLRDGLHHVEDRGGGLARWTNGEFGLDPRLWAGLSGQIALHIAYDHMTVRGWIGAPPAAKTVDAVDRPKLYTVS